MYATIELFFERTVDKTMSFHLVLQCKSQSVPAFQKALFRQETDQALKLVRYGSH